MGQEQGYTNHDDFYVLEFYAVFTKSKAHLSDGIDQECIFKFKHQIHFLSQYMVFCAWTQTPE